MLFLIHFILIKRNISNQRMASFFVTFSKRRGNECASFVSVYSLRSHFSRRTLVAINSSSVWGLDLCTLPRQRHSKCSDQVSLLLYWSFGITFGKFFVKFKFFSYPSCLIIIITNSSTKQTAWFVFFLFDHSLNPSFGLVLRFGHFFD